MKRSAIQWEIISSRLHNFELIFEIQEVELQCGFSLYGSCLSGDVH